MMGTMRGLGALSLDKGMVAIGIAVNAAIVVALLLSRGGQTADITVVVNDGRMKSTFDGQTLSATLDMPVRGGVFIELRAPEKLASLDGPSGIDSVEIIDRDAGVSVLREDFSGTLDAWTGASNVVARDGLLQLGPAAVAIGRIEINGDWTDTEVRIKGRNLQDLIVGVRARGVDNYAAYHVRPLRHLDQGFQVWRDGRAVPGNEGAFSGGSFGGPAAQPSARGTVASIAQIVLPSYATWLLGVTGLIAVAVLLGAVPGRAPEPVRELWGRLPFRRIASGTAAALSLTTFAIALTLELRYLQAIPHIPDAVAYIFQAKIMASGHLAVPPPGVEKSFAFFYPPMMWADGDRWASVFPLGHSLILVPAVWLHALWLMPPLLGAANVALVFVVGRGAYGARTGLVAAMLYAFSPFALMNAADFMSHTTAAFYLLGAIALYFLPQRRLALTAIAAGIAYGLLFNTRPMTSVAMAPAFGLAMAMHARSAAWRIDVVRARRIGWFALGAALMFGVYLFYNYSTTGDALSSGYAASNQASFGFDETFTIRQGLANLQMLTAVHVVIVNGWPAWAGVMFAIAPFALGTRNHRDWLMLLAIVSVVAGYVLYPGTGIAYGPRFWFETTPLLMLLMARGAALLGERADGAAARLLTMMQLTPGQRWVSALLVHAMLVVLVALSVHGWLLGRDARWQSDGTPATAQDLRGFNAVDDLLIERIRDDRLQNALILVEPCPSWQCYGVVFWLNDPHLDGRVVIAQRIEAELPDLLRLYPDRRVYSADRSRRVLFPYGTDPTSPGDPLDDPSAAPLASELLQTLE